MPPERLALHSNGFACVKSNSPALRQSRVIHHNRGEVLKLGTGRKKPNDNTLILDELTCQLIVCSTLLRDWL